MITEQQIKAILNTINSISEFENCDVGLYSNNKSKVIQERTTSHRDYNIVIIIEELNESGKISIQLHEPIAPVSGLSIQANAAPSADVLNKDRLQAELVGTGLSCGVAFIGWAGVLVGGAFAIPSGGTSLIVFLASWTGAVTGTAQCVNGILRSNEANSHPEGTTLAIVDRDAGYSSFFNFIDKVGLVAGILSGIGAYKSIKSILTLRGTLPSEAALAKMGDTEAKIAIKEGLKNEMYKSANGKDEIEKAIKGALNPHEILEFNIITKLRHVTNNKKISAQLLKSLTRKLIVNRVGIPSEFVSLGANAAPPKYTGSASGYLNSQFVSRVVEVNQMGRTIIHVIEL